MAPRRAESASAGRFRKVDHTTENLFGITLVKVPKDGGGRIQFAVDVDTDKTTKIAVPRLAFCE